ncbi:hypothetical protein [Streptomyces sp. NPDC051554]|uniref:hypothetical protein n=1 Tax=Streptomyces sp. NPDC051554 TaxID=3365656 RepID=UPI0037A93EE8
MQRGRADRGVSRCRRGQGGCAGVQGCDRALNLATGANLALVPVGSDGSIDIYNSSGTVNVVADVEGYCIG